MKKVLLLVVLVAFAAVLFGCTQSTYPAVNLSTLTVAPADSVGNANAPVTVVEYSDFQCPLCRVWFLQSKAQLITEYVNTGKVLFEFKDFPLKQHPMSLTFAESARCAGEQGKYFEMHDKLYTEQDKIANGEITTVTSVTLADIANWAKDLGLDSNQFNTCLTLGKFDAQIAADENEGSGIGVNGTPSFVIGKTNGAGVLIAGAVPYSTLKAQIDQALQ